MRPTSTSLTGVGTSAWVPIDAYSTGLYAQVTGTVTYSIEVTPDNIFDATVTPVAYGCGLSNLTASTTNQAGELTTRTRAIRINISAGTGTVKLTGINSQYNAQNLGNVAQGTQLTPAQLAAGASGALSTDASGEVISVNGRAANFLRNVGSSSYGVSYVRNLPREAAPTVTINTVATLTQVFKGVIAGQAAPDFTKFAFYGASKGLFAPRHSTAATQNTVCQAARASSDSLGGTRFLTSFHFIGQSIDLIRFASGDDCCIFVDGQYIGRVAVAVRQNTCQAGSTSTTMVLDAGASAVNGQYNLCYARITGGTGTLGEVRQITGYVGATRTLTVNAAWTVTPDVSTTFSVDESPIGSLAAAPTLQYITLTFPTASPPQPVTRLIQIVSAQFAGVNIGQTDSINPGLPMSDGALFMFLGDSFMDGTRSPDCGLPPHYEMALAFQMQPCNLSSGSTGWWTRGTSNRLNFLNRVAPPTESWEIASPQFQSASSGTWTISITYNGTTQTTSALAFNVANSAVETALNALTFNGFAASTGVSYVGPSGQGCFCVARGDLNAPFIIVANGMVGATISIDNTNLVGGVAGPVTLYFGDVAKNVPKDPSGNPLPFFLYMQGSGNDSGASGYSDALLQANAISIAQALVNKFPTCIPIFGGIVANSDGTGGNGIITASDAAHNAAILAGAQFLPKLHGQVPFVDTYAEGVGGEAYYTGTGTIGAPTNGKRDIYKSLLATGHPTGAGKAYWCARDTRVMHRLINGPTA